MHHRESNQTHIEGIQRYSIARTDADNEAQRLHARYANLRRKDAQAAEVRKSLSQEERKNFQGVLSLSERQESKRLKQQLLLLKDVLNKELQSVLQLSGGEEELDSGKDNNVFVIPNKRYVTKYSTSNYQAMPETVEYLQKKYQVLQKYLSPFIPRSRFVLGERRVPVELKQAHKTTSLFRDAAVTIQQRIHGKTFQAMTLEEKSRPEVLASLQTAHAQYMDLKRRVANTALALGLPEDTMDVKLDIGHLSKYENVDIFDPERVREFMSPNIMYDEQRGQIFFIDFDMNEWNEEKECVFQELMG